MASQGRQPSFEALDPVLRAFGGSLLRVRTARRMTQRALAEASGVSQSAISLVERGQLDDVTVATLIALTEPLDIRLDLVLTGPLLYGLDATRDLVHARCIQALARVLADDGWVVREEVPVGGGDVLGFIDLLAFHPATGVLLIIEVKTRILDVGGLYRALGVYEEWATEAAGRFGWQPTRRITALALLASDETLNDVRTHRASLSRRLPGATADVRRWLQDPRPLLGDVLFWVDPDPEPGNPIIATEPTEPGTAPYIDHAHAVRLLAS